MEQAVLELITTLAKSNTLNLIILMPVALTAMQMLMAFWQSRRERANDEILKLALSLYGSTATSLDALTAAVQAQGQYQQQALNLQQLALKRHERNEERIVDVHEKHTVIQKNQDQILHSLLAMRREQTTILAALQGNGESLGLIASMQNLSDGLMRKLNALMVQLPKESKGENVESVTDNDVSVASSAAAAERGAEPGAGVALPPDPAAAERGERDGGTSRSTARGGDPGPGEHD